MKEAAYIVSVEGDGISVADPNGEEKSARAGEPQRRDDRDQR